MNQHNNITAVNKTGKDTPFRRESRHATDKLIYGNEAESGGCCSFRQHSV